MMTTSVKNPKYTVYFIYLIANLLIFLFVYTQATQITSLHNYWSKSTNNSLATATELAKIERSLGYVGFIHQFKNFIIRGDDRYYAETKKYYQKVKSSILKLEELLINSHDKTPLKTLTSTIDEYLSKLELAKEMQGEVPIYTLDELVKVNDNYAEAALIQLREAILPKLKKQQLIINSQVDDLKKTSFYLALILIPFFLIVTVITVRLLKNALHTYQEVSMIFEMTPDGIIYSDIDGAILKVNKAACNIFGYAQESFTSMKIEDLLPSFQREAHVSLRQNFMSIEQKRQMGNRSSKIKAIKHDGTIIEVKISISATKLDGEMRAVCVVKDITEQNKLEQYAEKDHLTGLYNRRYFDDALHKELKRQDREEKSLSLILIDIDHFKKLNDTEGHTVGDLALKALADYLRENTREYDYIARWGGDEFALICPALNTENACIHAEKLRSGFEALKFPWKERLTLSIGIATASSDTPYSVNGIMHAVDKAVYAAKSAGRNQIIHTDDLKTDTSVSIK